MARVPITVDEPGGGGEDTPLPVGPHSYTVGDQDEAGTRLIGIQIKDQNGDDFTGPAALLMYLVDEAGDFAQNGLAINGIPTGDPIQPIVAGQQIALQADAGVIEITVADGNEVGGIQGRVSTILVDGTIDQSDLFAIEPVGEAPTVSSYSSPAADTLRIEGTGLDLVARVATAWSNGNLYAGGVLDPDQANTNSGNGVTIVEWTDTAIEFTSAFIPTGTATALDLQDATYTNLIATLLSPGDFPAFNAQ